MSDPAPSRWPARAILLTALVLHVLLLLYFARPSVMFGDEPVAAIDYTLHVYQVDRARQAFEGWGRLWGYDPQMLAGHPAGALEDLTSKGMELFVIGLGKLGLGQALAFNMFILLVHLLVPLWAYLTAWLFGLSPVQRATAVLLWVVLWFWDSLTHWIWYCGMISWAAGSCLALLLVALVYRAVERGPPWTWLTVAPLSALLVTVHPFGAVVAVPACALLYLRRVRDLGRWDHAGVALTIALPVAVSAIWLTTAARMWHYVDELISFLKPSLDTLAWDFFDVLEDPWDTGMAPVRTLFRFLCLVAACFMLWRLRREKDPRWLPLGVTIGLCLFLSYGGGIFEATSKIQPYRLMMPATLLAALPAAMLLPQLLAPARLRAMSRPTKILLVLLLVLLLPRLVRTVVVAMPDPLPPPHRTLPGSTPLDFKQEPLSGVFGFPPAPLRHLGTDPNHKALRSWLLEHYKKRPARVLVQDWILGEYLAWSTRMPILGGLEQRAIHHADAHLFRSHPKGDLKGKALRDYFVRYAVGFVVVRAPQPALHTLPDLEGRKDLLLYVGKEGGYRIYLTKVLPSYFLRGKGRVLSQAFNSIKVETASDDVVIRFHWMETLRCRPGCTVERFKVPGDRVGFIRVKKPPRRFEIYNGY